MQHDRVQLSPAMSIWLRIANIVQHECKQFVPEVPIAMCWTSLQRRQVAYLLSTWRQQNSKDTHYSFPNCSTGFPCFHPTLHTSVGATEYFWYLHMHIHHHYGIRSESLHVCIASHIVMSAHITSHIHPEEAEQSKATEVESIIKRACICICICISILHRRPASSKDLALPVAHYIVISRPSTSTSPSQTTTTSPKHFVFAS